MNTGAFISLFFRERFSNLIAIRNVKCPTLFIHGKKDKLIPTEHSLELFERCRATRKKLVVPEDMEHNSNLFAHADFLVLTLVPLFARQKTVSVTLWGSV